YYMTPVRKGEHQPASWRPIYAGLSSRGLFPVQRRQAAVLVMMVVVVATAYLMNRTRIGRQIYALGGNPEAAARARYQHSGRRAHGLWLSRIPRCRRRFHPGRPGPSGRADGDGRHRTQRARSRDPWRSESRRRYWLDGRCRARRALPCDAPEWVEPSRGLLLLL